MIRSYDCILIANSTGSNNSIPRPDGFLSFGPSAGDSMLPKILESSEEVALNPDIVFFGSKYNKLYVSYIQLARRLESTFIGYFGYQI